MCVLRQRLLVMDTMKIIKRIKLYIYLYFTNKKLHLFLFKGTVADTQLDPSY